MASRFDQAYYERFYEDAATRAVSPAEQQRQARFIAAYLRYLGIDVAEVLDVGCGMGTMLKTIGAEFPEATTRGVEFSEYLCETLGWEPGSVVDYAGPAADLVICNDVLGYLNKKACQDAIRNLARLADKALYVSVLTEEDLEICDQASTDMRQKIRPAAFYQRALGQHFVNVGGGLYLRKPLRYPVWALERADP